MLNKRLFLYLIAGTPVGNGSKRHSWSSEEKDAVKKLFSEHIRTRTSPSLYEVSSVRTETPKLQKLNETQILGCVNNMIAREKKGKSQPVLARGNTYPMLHEICHSLCFVHALHKIYNYHP